MIEVVLPAVDTDLQAPGLHTFGVSVDEFADAVFEGLAKGDAEIAYGSALIASKASRSQLDRILLDLICGVVRVLRNVRLECAFGTFKRSRRIPNIFNF